MPDENRIQEILDNFDPDITPEEACGDDLDLLSRVRPRWEQMRRLNLQFEALLPADRGTQVARDTSTTEIEFPKIDGYDVEHLLGRGGMGIVFKAKHRKLNRFVALKMMLNSSFANPIELARFRRESEAIAALRHPNIVQIHDVGELDGRHFFTMEFVEAGNLCQQLAGNPQAATAAAEMIATLACAIQFAHKCGFIHRDLKPANILIAADGTPKITDFGLARAIDAGPEFTMSGARVGTPSYMAPEQALGNAHAIGPAVDIYGLGAILYEMITGRRPFDGASVVETERKVIEEEPVRPSRWNSRIPRDLENICLKCLQKNPSRRYASAQDLADDLYRFLDRKPVLARPVGMIERTLKWARRRPALATLFLFLALAIGFGYWFEHARRVELDFRRSMAQRALETGIAQAIHSAQSGRLQEAHLLLKEAANHLFNADSAEWRERLAQAEREIKFAQELVEVTEAAAESTIDQIGQIEQRGVGLLLTGYQQAFVRAGYDLGADPTIVAAQIRASVLGKRTIASLDEWALATFINKDEAQTQKLLRIVRLADPDPDWGDQFRELSTWRDKAKLSTLATKTLSVTSPSPTHHMAMLANLLRSHGAKSEGIGLLQEAVRRHPTDFWLNGEIAEAYLSDNKHKEAAPFFRTLVALRPNKPWIICRLGICLVSSGNFDEGIKHLYDAHQLQPNRHVFAYNLVTGLAKVGRVDDALLEARKMLESEPTNADAAFVCGSVLGFAGRHQQSLEMYQKAAEIRPNDLRNEESVGEALRQCGRYEEAIVQFQKAVKLNPNGALGHCRLAITLYQMGRYAEAIPECEFVIQNLDPNNRISNVDFAERISPEYIAVRQCYATSLLFLGRFAEAHSAADNYLALPVALTPGRSAMNEQRSLSWLLMPLEQALSYLLAGGEIKTQPSMEEAVPGAEAALAEWCYRYKRLPVTAVKWYEDAFRRKTSLLENLEARHRFHAACAAALAGCGMESEGEKLDEQAKAGLRLKALNWLRADMGVLIKRQSEGRSALFFAMLWQQSADLACVRDQDALAKFSEEERRNWHSLWADIKALAVGDSGQILLDARAHIDGKRWVQAAECYAQLKYTTLAQSELLFEAAATQLLAGDHVAYRETCERMLSDKTLRRYLVARASTLAPNSAANVALAADLAGAELKRFEIQFWALTELGALSLRGGDSKEAITLFERSLEAEARPGAAVLNWLWLARAYQELRNPEEARAWLNKASLWLDNLGGELPKNSEYLNLHRHNWLEAHILRREVESLIATDSSQ
jgi:tetratricopeptide (TPR) repeat protein/tRNA A-37 threonylcarbamoyl transferase component Bud32